MTTPHYAPSGRAKRGDLAPSVPATPVTSAWLRRAPVAYIGVWLAGLLFDLFSGNPRLVGFGLGLMVPGGGLLYYGHWLEFPVVLAAFVVAVALRRHSGSMLVPLAIWLGVAAVELTHNPEPQEVWLAARWVVPMVCAALPLVAVLVSRYGSRERA